MNQLVHAAEFREALDAYRPSNVVKQVLTDMKLLLFVAPTATGRDTVIRELQKTGNYHPIISNTTREPRKNNGILEQNGRDYWFRNEDEMLRQLREGNLVGAAIIHNQQVSGIGVDELVDAQQDSKIAVTDIEIAGALDIHKLKPDTMSVFMVPLSFDIWMERLHLRGYMTPEELERRMESAERELSTALKSDYFRFILNDTLQGAVTEIDHLVRAGEYDPFKEHSVREIAEKLYKEVSAYLGTHAHPTL